MKVHSIIDDTLFPGAWDLKELIRQGMTPPHLPDGHIERLEYQVEHLQRMVARLVLLLVQKKDLSERGPMEIEECKPVGDDFEYPKREVHGFPILSQYLRRDVWTETEQS